MSYVLTDTDVVVLEALEFEPGCEGSTHDEGLYGHIVDQPATWLVSFPCGEGGMTCDGWVQTALNGPYSAVECDCGEYHVYSDCSFVPLRQLP